MYHFKEASDQSLFRLPNNSAAPVIISKSELQDLGICCCIYKDKAKQVTEGSEVVISIGVNPGEE